MQQRIKTELEAILVLSFWHNYFFILLQFHGCNIYIYIYIFEGKKATGENYRTDRNRDAVLRC
jgi:hypothetical protein